jgi:hypothetical protein
MSIFFKINHFPLFFCDPLSLVLDLHIVHDRFGSSVDSNLNGHLHYSNDMGPQRILYLTFSCFFYRNSLFPTFFCSSTSTSLCDRLQKLSSSSDTCLNVSIFIKLHSFNKLLQLP